MGTEDYYSSNQTEAASFLSVWLATRGHSMYSKVRSFASRSSQFNNALALHLQNVESQSQNSTCFFFDPCGRQDASRAPSSPTMQSFVVKGKVKLDSRRLKDEKNCYLPSPSSGCGKIDDIISWRSMDQILLTSVSPVVSFFETFSVCLLRAAPLCLSAVFSLSSKRADRQKWNQFFKIGCSLGPTTAKFLQWASTRRYLFPSKFCDELGRYQVAIPPAPLPYSISSILMCMPEISCNNTERDQKRINKLILNPNAVGSGCVAQVFEAMVPSEWSPELKRNSFNLSSMENLLVEKLRSMTTTVLSQISKILKNERIKNKFHCGEDIHSPNCHSFDKVAIKVLRPNIRSKISHDLYLMNIGATMLQKLLETTLGYSFPIVQSVDQFKSLMIRQTDLLLEAKNMVLFKRNFSSKWSKLLLSGLGGRVVIPHVFGSLSSSQVLVESYEDGMLLEKYLTMIRNSEILEHDNKMDKIRQREQISMFGASMFFQMLLWDNFIHGDLHPGNVLIRFRNAGSSSSADLPRNRFYDYFVRRPLFLFIKTLFSVDSTPDLLDDYRSIFELVILDGGLATSFLPRDRVNLLDLIRAIVVGDGHTAGRLIVERGDNESCIDPDGFCNEINSILSLFVNPIYLASEEEVYSTVGFSLFSNALEIVYRWYVGIQSSLFPTSSNSASSFHFKSKRILFPSSLPLSEMHFGEVFHRLVVCCYNHKVNLDATFIRFILAVIILEGVGKSLNPNMDLLQVARPFLFGLLK